MSTSEIQIEAVKAGQFTAVFTRGDDAKAFYDRLVAEPEGFHVEPGSVKFNRKGGRQVSWQAGARAFEDHHRDDSPGVLQYWADMAETAGYYGSTFGEPPFGTGQRTACLNGRPGQACM
jgi:hypothetical protein